MHAKTLSLLVLPCLLLAPGCGGDGTAEQVVSTVSGRVVAGPVAGAEVTVLPLLNTGALGTALGEGTTDAQGFYSFSVSGHVGPAVILARGGGYVDEATGNQIVADDLELASLVMLAEGDHTAHLTAATTIAARRAMLLATDPTVDATAALENGVAMVEEYYGFEGILTVLPADLTAGPVPAGPAAEYGALNAGFSQLAADRGIYLWSLVSELSKDASDGMFDGHFYAGPLYVAGPGGEGDLFTDTGGAETQDAIGAFMAQPRNASGLGLADLSIDEEIARHIEEDPDLSVCVYQPRIDAVDPPLGLVNQETEVTLYGQFPTLETVSLVVKFGGVAAQIIKSGEDEILVTAPAAPVAGKVDVAVLCANTHVHGVAPKSFEYYVPNLEPAITGVTPDRGPGAGGTLLEVTGSNFDPTAIVEVGGTQAQTLARLGRTVLVAIVPPGTGTVDVTVRQADTVSAPHATAAGAFSYFDQGIGEEPSDTALDGQWKAYAIAHQFPEAVLLMNANLTLAGGTYSENGEMWVATPADPEGTPMALNQNGTARSFADGTVWFKDSEQENTSRAFLSPERDVFVLANDASTGGPVWLGAGIRRASGMSNASLTGTWHVALFSHGYETDADERTISSAWGTAEFDGFGHGSAGLITATCATSPDGEDRRESIGASFTYAVAPDGTFTITITLPDEDTPIVFHGSVTGAKDLAVAVSAEGGEAQLLMMVPSAEGFGPPYVQGSFYGGGIAYEYLPGFMGHVFAGETIRTVNDGRGEGVAEVTVRVTSDLAANGGMETQAHAGETYCEATGLLIGGPDDLAGFLSASRCFQITLPANLEASPEVSPVEFMGAGLLVRRPATYSSWTLDGASYNTVGISTEYKAPGAPLSVEEENTSFRTRLEFDASGSVSEEDESDLIGLVREPAGARTEKTIYRTTDGELDGVISSNSRESLGPYAVFGDGRMILNAEPVNPELAASEEDMLEQIVGEISGNADLVFLRNAVNPDGASALLVLARVGNPVLSGPYNGAALRFNWAPDWEWAEAGLGSVTFDTGTAKAAIAGTLYGEEPDGSVYRETESWTGVDFTVSGGVVDLAHPIAALTGVATPDGTALFLVDLDETPSTGLYFGLKRPTGAIQSAGSYTMAGFAHRYDTSSISLPVEAGKRVLQGPWRITSKLDVGFLDDIRTNTFAHVDRRADLVTDSDLAVNTDGSLVWPAGYSMGSFSSNGRHAFLMTADLIDGEIYPGAIGLKILTR